MRLFNNLVNKSLASLGLEVRRKQHNQSLADSMPAALHRIRAQGISPKSVIDLGAAQGEWSRLSSSVWPTAQHYLFEPLTERHELLQNMCRSNDRLNLIAKAAGPSDDSATFTVTGDLDGSGFYGCDTNSHASHRIVPQISIDRAVDEKRAKPPFLIKFDTHGYEVPIIRGATRTLKQTQAIVMECYGFKVTPETLLLHEMSVELARHGFRLSDIIDIMRRPKDSMFWQCDAVFLRSDSQAFGRNTFNES